MQEAAGKPLLFGVVFFSPFCTSRCLRMQNDNLLELVQGKEIEVFASAFCICAGVVGVPTSAQCSLFPQEIELLEPGYKLPPAPL
jgi:hypothetical protein